MQFPARIYNDEGTYSVRFRDIPEALTNGATLEQAKSHAAEALEAALDFYFDDRVSVPTPSKAKRGEVLIDLPAYVTATVLLHNEMLEQKVSASELARRIGIPRQNMTRILDRKHPTRLDTIDTAFAALGRHLDMQVVQTAGRAHG